jgi:hypothetical protein
VKQSTLALKSALALIVVVLSSQAFAVSDSTCGEFNILPNFEAPALIMLKKGESVGIYALPTPMAESNVYLKQMAFDPTFPDKLTVNLEPSLIASMKVISIVIGDQTLACVDAIDIMK